MANMERTLEIPHSVMTLAETLVMRGGLSGADYCRLKSLAKWAGKKQGMSSEEIVEAALARAALQS